MTTSDCYTTEALKPILKQTTQQLFMLVPGTDTSVKIVKSDFLNTVLPQFPREANWILVQGRQGWLIKFDNYGEGF